MNVHPIPLICKCKAMENIGIIYLNFIIGLYKSCFNKVHLTHHNSDKVSLNSIQFNRNSFPIVL